MTHYWWMHWFWITISIVVTSEETVSYSSSTIEPSINANFTLRSNRTSKEIRNITVFATSTYPSIYTKNANVIKNLTTLDVKSNKPYLNKIDLFLSDVTVKNKTKDTKETVLDKNITESLNLTENQLLINANSSEIIHADNITYLQSEASSIQSSEKIISIEMQDNMDGAKGNLSAAGITGITLGCVVIIGILCGVSYFLYYNRGFNRPQVLSDHCSNPDSSGYIDDASVRDNSEEMYSLDNDSFLNSLEAMAIQNYWTDTVKHTKL